MDPSRHLFIERNIDRAEQSDHEQADPVEAFPQSQTDISELHRHDFPRQRHPQRRSPDDGPAADRVIECARVIDQPGICRKLGQAGYESEKKKPPQESVAPGERKADQQTLSTILRAAPVRQSDHGANASSETAMMLMAIVAITTHNRPRSSDRSERLRESRSRSNESRRHSQSPSRSQLAGVCVRSRNKSGHALTRVLSSC
jgi:hypothetical protein